MDMCECHQCQTMTYTVAMNPFALVHGYDNHAPTDETCYSPLVDNCANVACHSEKGTIGKLTHLPLQPSFQRYQARQL